MRTSDKIYLIQSRSRRLSAISTLFLFLSAVCVLCMGIIGGIAIYRTYMQNRMQRLRFQGMCGLPYENDFDAEAQMLNMLNEHFKQFAENLDDMYVSLKRKTIFTVSDTKLLTFLVKKPKDSVTNGWKNQRLRINFSMKNSIWI